LNGIVRLVEKQKTRALCDLEARVGMTNLGNQYRARTWLYAIDVVAADQFADHPSLNRSAGIFSIYPLRHSTPRFLLIIDKSANRS
jgi:hypothetical protein